MGKAFSDVPYAEDSAHRDVECSARGICTSAGTCHCEVGFTGIACERTMCKNDCNHRGHCVSMRNLAETTRDHLSQQYAYDLVWDSEKIYGCLCDDGYGGYDCSLRTCPAGDDPLTTDGNLQEVQLLRCSATGTIGTLAFYFDGKPSKSIPSSASAAELKSALETISTIGEISVSYSEGTTLCRDNIINIASITFVQNFGPLPPLVPQSFGMEPSSVVEVAGDKSYGMLTDHNGIDYFAIKGNKENDECSNRGICDQGTGTCRCFDTNGDSYAGSDGYGNAGDRGDCGHAVTAPITTCPGDPPCSDRGYCDPVTLRCACEDGFSGGDCSLRTCKRGLSWFSYPSADNVAHDKLAECSDMGICIRTVGECRCHEQFFGAACEYMGCIGESSPFKSCSGHGTCVSMRELGMLREESDGTQSPLIYGSDPNESMTWDADRIFGCTCDDGYEGYDCSVRSCPVGPDPLTASLDQVCSNHGVCNDEGKCRCFPGWGSSDGSGNFGANMDCGHRLALRGYP